MPFVAVTVYGVVELGAAVTLAPRPLDGVKLAVGVQAYVNVFVAVKVVLFLKL